MKILFIENHERFASAVVKQFLQDHQVTVMPNMTDGWRELTTHGYDVVLVDYDLDDGKGSDLVVRIRSHALPVKIVAVSSHEQGNQALREAGADKVCDKMNFKHIREVLNTLPL